MSRFHAAFSALSLLTLADAAWAQPQPPQSQDMQVQEIVVTAERRPSILERTPGAISAVPAASLDKSFITGISALSGVVPNFQSTKTSGFETIVTIRGVGSETPENDLSTVPGVSLFVDGVYLVNTISLDQTLFDVARIEILRGPQGALYGQSAIGGAISIVSNPPELGAFKGFADVSAGTYGLTRERAWFNAPIGNTLAARVAVQRFDHDGFTADVAIPGLREDEAHDGAVKAALLWRPFDSFSATLTGEWRVSDTTGQAQKNINDATPGPWFIDQDYAGHNDLRAQLHRLNLEYDAGAFTVRSITAYQGLDSRLREDSSRSSIARIGAYDDVAAWDTNVASYTETIDAFSKPGGRFDWIAGAFALAQTSRQFVAEFEGGDTPKPNTTIASGIESHPPANLAYGNDSKVDRQSYSLYGQATWRAADRLRLTLGGRLNADRYTDRSFNFSAFGASSVEHSKSDLVPTWRAEADYDLSGVSLVYASVNRGYKPGGVNGDNGQVVVPATFEPETNTAFEVGAKNRFLGQALTLNLTAFYYLYKNMQYIEDDPRPFDSGIANIPDVHAYGAELEAAYVNPDGRLRLSGQVSFQRGRVVGPYATLDSTVVNRVENAGPPSPCASGGRFFNTACWDLVVAAATNIEGRSPPAMPSVSAQFTAAYRFDALGGALTPQVQFVWRGSEWARIFNEPSLDRVPGYGVVNLNLDYRPSGSALSVALTATNLFNIAGVNSQYTDPFGTGQTSRQYIAPRQVVVTLGYAF